MRTYELKRHLEEIYAQYPEGKHQPIIGITTNFVEHDARIADRYYLSVLEAGGTPVLIPPINDKDVIIGTLEHLDGLMLTGGADINPLWAGEEPSANLSNINSTRDLPELLITRLAYNRQMPILGICRGIQTLAVALDGKVQQHVASEIKHSQEAPRDELTHSVSIEPGTLLRKIFKDQKRLLVNSFHHQAVADPGKRFRVAARATDNTIEAMESSEYKPILGVQWHPEWLPEGAPLFKWLVDEAEKFYLNPDVYIETLARDMNSNRTYLSAYLHKERGTSFTAYVNDLRLQEAMPLLEKGTKRASEIAFLVGFSSEYTFRRIFKEKMGCTPREYSIKMRKA
jgi:gamma-glutamyl-gamma-aminobutyrate hydrolase PuuD